jgi:primosomal protein N' (replication factor Y)
LGLPVEGPFDYLVPSELEKRISAGMRVRVNFRDKREVAYVVGLSAKTKIRKIKEILGIIDGVAVLDEQMLLFTRALAEYYCCSWGEVIETALPESLRKGKTVDLPPIKPRSLPEKPAEGAGHIFVQGAQRLPVYIREIKRVFLAGRSAIILFSDILEAERVKELIQKELGQDVFLVFRKQPDELKIWENIRRAQNCVVLGTRSGIFAPVNNLGLIVVDQEQDQVYKQEQVPHYHAREAALMRAGICGAKVVLGGNIPSLESFYMCQEGVFKLEHAPVLEGSYPFVQVIDNRRLAYSQRKDKPVFSKFLVDAISAGLSEKKKILVFIERRGFATSAACHSCGVALKCPRCNTNLVFHFEEGRLRCHHCNFSMDVPEICPNCRSGYIKYSGIGTEKVESELCRIFPQARIKLIEGDGKGPVSISGADIFVSTSSVVRQQGLKFDLTGVIAIDSSLNRMDFRAGEKVFSLLVGLAGITRGKMIIQSANINHHCLLAVVKNDPQIFLKEELRQRKQLSLPPYKHMILLKLRGAKLDKVKKESSGLFGELSSLRVPGVKMLSLNPGRPAKLRGNFYYQLLMRASNLDKAGRFLKLHLKDRRFSGIIVTVDVDPV